MFGIGSVARLAQVSVRTLRYYDELGLLRPRWVDPGTGYRWYAADQLHRLHRILALRDLGVRLAEIAVLLEKDLGVEELDGILQQQRTEARERMAAESERLAKVEARLRQLGEMPMSTHDVVVKAVDAEWVIAAGEDVADVSGIGDAHGRLWPRLHAVLDRLGLPFSPPSIAAESGADPIRLTAGLPVPRDLQFDEDGIVTMELSAIPRVAATVMQGDDFHSAYQALRTWVAEAGEVLARNESREVYLDCDGPRETWVVEIQLALAPRH